jgi:hypothetical protein
MRRLMFGALVALSIAATACSGSAAPAPMTSSSTPASITAASPSKTRASPSPTQAAIVGEWVGVHDCERIVSMLRGANLDEFLRDALYGNGLVAGDPQASALADPKHPCEGAVQRKHSHYFTESGHFGSKDFNGQQVDDGTYKLEGDDVIVINGSRFKYSIVGDRLSLEPEPVDISACTTRECRFEAAWVLMVAMPGMTWTRGEIKSQ